MSLPACQRTGKRRPTRRVWSGGGAPVYETLGLWRALWLSPRWQVRREFLVLVTDLDARETAPLLGTAKVQVQWGTLTDADIPAIHAANPRLSEIEMRRRWREGQECIGGWVDGSLAHYRWDTARTASLPYLRGVFEPLDGDTFVFDAFTHRAFRGQGIHALSTARALDRSRARGFRRSITLVAWWNVAALRVLREKAGRETAGTVVYWRLGIAEWHIVTGSVELGAHGRLHVAPRLAGGSS